MAQLVAVLPNAIQWSEDATLTLIRRRRLYQAMFASSRVQDQGTYWRNISQDIALVHNFAPTLEQCRNKWNSLKSGYENLARLIASNPHRQCWCGTMSHRIFNVLDVLDGTCAGHVLDILFKIIFIYYICIRIIKY